MILTGRKKGVCSRCEECEECNVLSYRSDFSIFDGDELVCDYCLENEYIRCDICGQYFDYCVNDYHTFDDERTVCESCYAELDQ